MGEIFSSNNENETRLVVHRDDDNKRLLRYAKFLAENRRLHEMTSKELKWFIDTVKIKSNKSLKTRMLRDVYGYFKIEIDYQYGIKYLDYPIRQDIGQQYKNDDQHTEEPQVKRQKQIHVIEVD